MMPRPSPTLRIAIGLVGLCVSLMLLADLLFGVLPDRQKQADALRARIAEFTTAQTADAVRQGDITRIAETLAAVRSRNPDMLSAAVRNAAGKVIASSGPHAPDWADQHDNRSSATRVIVPILSAQGTWGRTEFAFAPALPSTIGGWLHDKVLWLALGLPLVTIGLMYLYLRRVLTVMNPMAVVPDRLRDAFDGLTEGVALLDARGRVVLANAALRDMAAVDPQKMHGRLLQSAVALQLVDTQAVPPWQSVLQGAATVRGVRVLVGEGARRKTGMMNCSAILDPQGKVRGCLATLDDVTETERNNDELRSALAELRHSRQQIEAQNQELVKLATRDSLTGLLNRRAFFDSAGQVLARCASGGQVAVIMLDVDHFKSFNDKYGHAVGDTVLQRVAERMRASLRQQDLVARYGGEEFCALMEDVDEATAAKLAERVRGAIQFEAGLGIHDGRDLAVTASIGVCWRAMPPGPCDLSDMLRHADAALYAAKRGGRNRVLRSEGTLVERRAPANRANVVALSEETSARNDAADSRSAGNDTAWSGSAGRAESAVAAL